ncbi:hypothetical protein FSP39_002453 [Pinctada imbricata]|uniref:Uncharacterized protein n=1 Tax=Pinctada imbricata TaxID=66713 RepID=A0AA88XKW2_PINIB|nr:hypothetical protein FSP39_002453 [Pinctada imbricata]
MKLQRLHEWSELVEITIANWVLYDDVFERDLPEKNRSQIATIKACVQDEYSKVIFTVTDEIFKQNEGSFQKMIPTKSIINFEESPHTLCVEMKNKILMSHLRVNDVSVKAMKRPSFIMNDTEDKKEIYESDIQEIILKKPLHYINIISFPCVNIDGGCV